MKTLSAVDAAVFARRLVSFYVNEIIANKDANPAKAAEAEEFLAETLADLSDLEMQIAQGRN